METRKADVSNKACVVGGTGNLASMLIKHLLQRGYSVNTTVRDPENEKKTAHLKPLQELGDLKIFKADLTDEESFNAPIAGCEYVFHVATPVNFASKDPENDMIKPAIKGVMNVLKSCAKAESVKRVIYTSSAAAVSINNNLSGPGLVMDERNWTDIEFLTNQKPPNWGYPASKTVAESAAWKFAGEKNIDLITVIPVLLSGTSLLSDPPSSLSLSMSLITGDKFFLNGLKEMQTLSGSVSLVHVEDVARAHVFLAEKETASGRYICCAHNSSVPEIAEFLKQRFTKYNVVSIFEDLPLKAKLRVSSEKLMNEGFRYEYGIYEIYDEMIEYFESKGLLKAEES